jgi:hypothetical protein
MKIVLLVLALIAPLAACSGAANSPAGVTTDNANDVTVSDCTRKWLGDSKFIKIAYTVNNAGKDSRSYDIQFSVLDPSGTSIGQASAFEAGVQPGRPSKGEASGNMVTASHGPYTCEITRVTTTRG